MKIKMNIIDNLYFKVQKIINLNLFIDSVISLVSIQTEINVLLVNFKEQKMNIVLENLKNYVNIINFRKKDDII